MSSGIDTAVILAAGMGNRISRVSKDIPKPLLPIDGKEGGLTFLDFHLAALAKAGCKRAFIVGNKKTHGTKLRNDALLDTKWILNPTDDLSTSGSGHSAYLAFESEHAILDSQSRVVLMDADLLYTPSLFSLFGRTARERSTTLVCADFRETDEEVLVFADSDALSLPRFHGKGLLKGTLSQNAMCLGEATGILLFEPHDHEALRDAARWQMKFSTPKLRSEHEDVTQRMMLMKRMRAECFSSRDYDFMEVDTPEEYEIACREMSAKVREPRLRPAIGT